MKTYINLLKHTCNIITTSSPEKETFFIMKIRTPDINILLHQFNWQANISEKEPEVDSISQFP